VFAVTLFCAVILLLFLQSAVWSGDDGTRSQCPHFAIRLTSSSSTLAGRQAKTLFCAVCCVLQAAVWPGVDGTRHHLSSRARSAALGSIHAFRGVNIRLDYEAPAAAAAGFAEGDVVLVWSVQEQGQRGRAGGAEQSAKRLQLQQLLRHETVHCVAATCMWQLRARQAVGCAS
jgi:hypothetical protein